MSIDSSDMKHQFSRQLVLLLERAYGGRVPSLSVLARDLSLRAPHLPHVSTEAVRKWLRGNAIPQSPRMQVLVEWLGDDLLEPLTQTNHYPHGQSPPTQANRQNDSLVLGTAMKLLESLDKSDQKLVLKLLQSLATKEKANAPDNSLSNGYAAPGSDATPIQTVATPFK